MQKLIIGNLLSELYENYPGYTSHRIEKFDFNGEIAKNLAKHTLNEAVVWDLNTGMIL